MSTADVKNEIVKKIDRITSPIVLENLDHIVDDLLAKSLGKDFWDDIPDSLRKGIEKAEADMNAGKGTPHEKVLREVKRRFNLK